MPEPRLILVPFDARECLSIVEAATIAGVKSQSIRNWCEQFGIGRKIGAHWRVSRVALRMFLNGDTQSLAAYHRGDRASAIVVHYYASEGLADISFSYLPSLQQRVG